MWGRRRRDRTINVVAWTRHYWGRTYDGDELRIRWRGEPITGRFTSDRRRWKQAEAIWFHAPTFRRFSRRKRAGQKWVVMSMESEVNHPRLLDPMFMDHFDLRMTYRLDSDVPVPYYDPSVYGAGLRAAPPTRVESDGRAPLVYIQANPVGWRDDYVQALMRHIRVDAPGKCLNNIRLDGFPAPQAVWDDGGWQRKIDLLRGYPFTIAFENARDPDYVTEKLYDPLIAGSVPVYVGAPNVRDLIPSPNAAVFADDFADPAALAAHLHERLRDPAADEAFQAWRREPFGTSFRAVAALTRVPARVRLLVKLAHGCDGSCDCGRHPEDIEVLTDAADRAIG